MAAPPPAALTHFDARGAAHMVDVGEKAATRRRATATGHITMQPATFALLQQGRAAKGDVLGVAQLAALQGCKRTAELIPLCHPVALTHASAHFEPDAQSAKVHIRVSAETTGPTGVEMEALTGVMAGLLSIYDMLKAVDRGMCIGGVRLLEKSGGRSGAWQAP